LLYFDEYIAIGIVTAGSMQRSEMRGVQRSRCIVKYQAKERKKESEGEREVMAKTAETPVIGETSHATDSPLWAPATGMIN
jgi:hypothetical protein